MELTSVLEMPPTGARPRLDRDRGLLVGSRCSNCGAASWPGRAICHRCGEPAMTQTSFPAAGQLLTYTTVWVARPGLTPPYTLGQIKVDDGPVVFGHVRGMPAGTLVPAAVRVVMGADPDAVPTFWFELEEAS